MATPIAGLIAALALALVLAGAGCPGPGAPSSASPAPRAGEPAPRGVVLIIGDGMGAAHVTLAQLVRGEQFQIGRLPHVGLVLTRPEGALVTDSAAAATALATGVRTANGFVGVGPDRRPHQTLLELATARGLATGIVTTAVITDATPAAFVAHHHDRKDHAVIAEQIARSRVDVLIGNGGGDPPSALDAGDGPLRVALRPGELDGDSPDAALPELARRALDRLARDPDGFVLVVEHEGIDTASHHHASERVEASLQSLDAAVGVALERPDLLVIVVGDHETGGLQIQDDRRLVWTSTNHTGEAVPLFARGPGAAAFARVLDHAEVGRALLAVVGAMGRAR